MKLYNVIGDNMENKISNDNTEFNVKLKALRMLNGYTQEELAKELSLSKANISKYESGAIEPNLKTLELLSKAFHCSVGYLLGLEEQSTYVSPFKPVKQRIIDMMNENNITKEEFAKIAGVKPEIVDYWLDGKLPLGDAQQIRIYDYFMKAYPKTKNYPLNYLYEPITDDFSEKEKSFITAYRNKPEMQPAVDKLLGIDTPSEC